MHYLQRCKLNSSALNNIITCMYVIHTDTTRYNKYFVYTAKSEIVPTKYKNIKGCKKELKRR